MRFNLKVFARVLKKRHPGKLHFTFFSSIKIVRLFILKEVKPSTESKMVKLLTFQGHPTTIFGKLSVRKTI